MSLTTLNRRSLLAALASLPLLKVSAKANNDNAYVLVADDGTPLQNFRIPAELDPATSPGIVWKNRSKADVVLYEFFDYNCGFCRLAAGLLDKEIRASDAVRFGLINNPILSLGSVQAAKVQQAILRLYGPETAYKFHLALFSDHGLKDGVSALAVAKTMTLDKTKIEQTADSPTVSGVIRRQAKLAENLAMNITPSFIIAGTGLMGWPGIKSLKVIINSARRCDHPMCG